MCLVGLKAAVKAQPAQGEFCGPLCASLKGPVSPYTCAHCGALGRPLPPLKFIYIQFQACPRGHCLLTHIRGSAIAPSLRSRHSKRTGTTPNRPTTGPGTPSPWAALMSEMGGRLHKPSTNTDHPGPARRYLASWWTSRCTSIISTVRISTRRRRSSATPCS